MAVNKLLRCACSRARGEHHCGDLEEGGPKKPKQGKRTELRAAAKSRCTTEWGEPGVRNCAAFTCGLTEWSGAVAFAGMGEPGKT